jgi:citrate lyase subunit beta/citryl-CoA lyase
MVFENLEKIKNLTLKEKETLLNPKNSYKLKKGLHRSNMMLNPLNLKHLNRIDNLQADAITLNLEDAIAPSKKKEALINIALFLSNLKETKSEIIIRVNPLYSGGLEEIEFLKDFTFNAIRVSKVKNYNEIEKTLNILPNKEVHISLETKEAFKNLSSWKIDSRFSRANLGILDLLADLKLPQSLLKVKNETISYILTKFLIDSKSIGIEPVSFMYQDYKDTKGFEEFCKWEHTLGFNSKACMGPAQVDIANRIFAPSKEEITKAKEIKLAFEESSKKGVNGFIHQKYGFIDEPVYKDALNLLSKLN